MLRDEGQIIKKAKINEYEFGYLPTFKKIGRYKSDSYSDYKNSINPLAGYGYVDLINTGAFSNGLFLKQQGRGFIFESANDKNDTLKEKYGEEIFGLNRKTWLDIQTKNIKPQIMRFIKKQLGQ